MHRARRRQQVRAAGCKRSNRLYHAWYVDCSRSSMPVSYRSPRRPTPVETLARRYTGSGVLAARARAIIPGGDHLSGRPLVDQESTPMYFDQGRGALNQGHVEELVDHLAHPLDLSRHPFSVL